MSRLHRLSYWASSLGRWRQFQRMTKKKLDGKKRLRVCHEKGPESEDPSP